MYINSTKIVAPLKRLKIQPLQRYFQALHRNKASTFVTALVFGAILALILHTAASAEDLQTQTDSLTSLIKQNQDTQLFWDHLWQTTFMPDASKGETSLSDYVFNNVCKLFILIGLIFWCWKFGIAMTGQIYGGGAFVSIFLQAFFPIILCAIFLANNAYAARSLGLGLRDYVNHAKTGILEAKIQDISFKGAMSDIFITQDAAGKIAGQIQYCQQLYKPNISLPTTEKPTDKVALKKLSPQQLQAYRFIDCLKTVKTVIAEQRQIGEQQQCTSTALQSPCVFFTKFMDKLSKTIDISEVPQIVTTPSLSAYKILNTASGLVASASQKTLLNTIQYWTVSFMELALFIDALFAPLAISVAIIPARLNMTAGWLVSYLTILIAQIANVVVVGFASLQLSQSSTYSFSDIRFEYAIGLIAPMVSLSVVGGGGFFAAKTFMGANLAAVSAVAGVASSAASSVTMGISRALDKKR